jgi:hypothetical protein
MTIKRQLRRAGDRGDGDGDTPGTRATSTNGSYGPFKRW